MTMRLLLTGALTGTGVVILLAVADRLIHQNPFGLATGIVGVIAGGVMLLLGLLMAVTSYVLARGGQAVLLRRRLLAAAIFTGAAGLVSGTLAVVVWLVAGTPVFP
ncbi:MAG: hypothetical protein ACOY94_22195 [Bacillota bacterium]